MRYHIYIKQTESVDGCLLVTQSIQKENDEIVLHEEHRRVFRELEELLSTLSPEKDALVISSPASLGISYKDVIDRLEEIVQRGLILAIRFVEGTWKYGATQPLNKAVLETLIQSLREEYGITRLPENKKQTTGRKKTEYPSNWEDLYNEWNTGQITSAEFIEQSGLKRATFYNLLTEYKEILKSKEEFENKQAN